jgi:hypothetical protein
MAFTACPKCGYRGSFEDECPGCGVYVSKFLAMQERRAAQGLPSVPGSAGPVAAAGGGTPGDPDRVRRIAIGAVLIAAFAAVGYVVLSDWFGAAYAYRPPPGWVAMDEKEFRQAAEQVSSRGSIDMALHGVYLPSGAVPGAETAVIAVSEAKETVEISEATAARLRAGFEMARRQQRLEDAMDLSAELRRYGSMQALEMEMHFRMAGIEASQDQVIFGGDPGGFAVSFAGPTDLVRPGLEAFRASLGSFRILAPQGIRGAAWFKHGLRWAWILAGVVLLYTVQGRIRARS